MEQRIEDLIYILENAMAKQRYYIGKMYSYPNTQEFDPYDPDGSKRIRNNQIFKLYHDGVSLTTIANQLGLSVQRVHQIIHEN